MANKRKKLDAMPASGRAGCDRVLSRSILAAVFSIAFGSGGLLVAPGVLAQATGTPASAPSSTLSPLEIAQKDTDADAKEAAAAYKKYKDIRCTGSEVAVSDAKKELKRTNKQLDYTVANEANAHSEVIEATSAVESSKALLATAIANSGDPNTDVQTARKNFKHAEKHLRDIEKEREDQIRDERLAAYTFGVPDAVCGKAAATPPAPTLPPKT